MTALWTWSTASKQQLVQREKWLQAAGGTSVGRAHLLAKVCLCGLLHLGEDHGRDLLGHKVLGLAAELHLGPTRSPKANKAREQCLLCTATAKKPKGVRTSMTGLPFLSGLTLKGKLLMSFCTWASLKCCPMRRLASNTVFVGLDDACVWTPTSLELAPSKHPTTHTWRPSLSHLCLGASANDALHISEGHTGRSGAITLRVGNNINGVVLPHAHTAVVARSR